MADLAVKIGRDRAKKLKLQKAFEHKNGGNGELKITPEKEEKKKKNRSPKIEGLSQLIDQKGSMLSGFTSQVSTAVDYEEADRILDVFFAKKNCGI